MHCKERTKCGCQILIGFCSGHRAFEAAQRDVEKFLNDLITDDARFRFDGALHEVGCGGGFSGRRRVEGIDENIRVEKESTAHSSRPG